MTQQSGLLGSREENILHYYCYILKSLTVKIFINKNLLFLFWSNWSILIFILLHLGMLRWWRKSLRLLQKEGENLVFICILTCLCVWLGAKCFWDFFFPLFEKFSPSYVEILVGVFVWKMLHCDSSGLLQLLNTCPCVNQFTLLCHRASEQYVLLGSSLPTAFVCSGGNDCEYVIYNC